MPRFEITISSVIYLSQPNSFVDIGLFEGSLVGSCCNIFILLLYDAFNFNANVNGFFPFKYEI